MTASHTRIVYAFRFRVASPLARHVMRALLVALVLLGLSGTQGFAACKIGKLAELPVTMTNMKPMVSAKINGADALFVADSGAFFSLITPASAAALNLKTDSAPGLIV